MIDISEQLIDKMMVDIDDLLDFLLTKRELNIGDDYYRQFFNEDLNTAFSEYIATSIPDVEVGQYVWVITDGEYDYENRKYNKVIKPCYVHKKTIKKKYTFSVREINSYYCGTFTKNSIGKTIFLSEEEARKYLEK